MHKGILKGNMRAWLSISCAFAVAFSGGSYVNAESKLRGFQNATIATPPVNSTKEPSQRNAMDNFPKFDTGSKQLYELPARPSLRQLADHEVSGPYGGKGGRHFDDGAHATGVRAAYIRSGKFVDRLQLIYNDGNNAEGHGGSGGHDNVFELGTNEYITEVVVRSGSVIDQLVFKTNNGRISRRYGKGGGSKRHAKAPSGYMLGGIKGRSGRVVDQITFYWVPALPSSGEYTEHITSSVGGSGGKYFNDGRHKYGIESISVRSGKFVDAMQVTYHGDGQARKHGGSGGSEKTFTLREGEHITQVNVRSGKHVDQIQFVTNEGRWSPKYGRGGGKYHSFTAPPGYMLGSIRGRSGSVIDQLALVFVPVYEPKIEDGIVKLVQLYGQTGGSSGTFTKRISYETGVSTTHSSSSSTRTRISSEASVQAQVWTAEVTATLGMEWTQEIHNSFEFSSHETKMVATVIELDLSKPAYVYQAKFQGTLMGSPVTAWGESWYISDEPVPI